MSKVRNPTLAARQRVWSVLGAMNPGPYSGTWAGRSEWCDPPKGTAPAVPVRKDDNAWTYPAEGWSWTLTSCRS